MNSIEIKIIENNGVYICTIKQTLIKNSIRQVVSASIPYVEKAICEEIDNFNFFLRALNVKKNTC